MCVVLVVNELLEARDILCKVEISLLQVPFHSQGKYQHHSHVKDLFPDELQKIVCNWSCWPQENS